VIGSDCDVLLVCTHDDVCQSYPASARRSPCIGRPAGRNGNTSGQYEELAKRAAKRSSPLLALKAEQDALIAGATPWSIVTDAAGISDPGALVCAMGARDAEALTTRPRPSGARSRRFLTVDEQHDAGRHNAIRHKDLALLQQAELARATRPGR
jgi:hypothetical protein